jgi:hypothetical protein
MSNALRDQIKTPNQYLATIDTFLYVYRTGRTDSVCARQPPSEQHQRRKSHICAALDLTAGQKPSTLKGALQTPSQSLEPLTTGANPYRQKGGHSHYLL